MVYGLGLYWPLLHGLRLALPFALRITVSYQKFCILAVSWLLREAYDKAVVAILASKSLDEL